MISLTKKEYDKITNKNTCPDCDAKGKFMAGPCGGVSQNITCLGCHMRFDVGPTYDSSERIGKEERLNLDPIAIAEGTMSWSKYDCFEYLKHSCGGSLELHKIDHEISALVCRKCKMRQLFQDQRIIDMDVSSYKTLEFFEYVRNNNLLTVGLRQFDQEIKLLGHPEIWIIVDKDNFVQAACWSTIYRDSHLRAHPNHIAMEYKKVENK